MLLVAFDRVIVCMSLGMKIKIDVAGPKSSLFFASSSCMFRILYSDSQGHRHDGRHRLRPYNLLILSEFLKLLCVVCGEGVFSAANSRLDRRELGFSDL